MEDHSYTKLEDGMPGPHMQRRPASRFTLKDLALALLTICTLALGYREAARQAQLAAEPPARYSLHDSAKDRWLQYKWWTPYGKPAHDDESPDRLWQALRPAHGIVAVDKAWAADQQLPTSMSLPSDYSKGVYIIDAYHQLHCLKLMRQTMVELEANQPLTYPAGHAKHCFDSLRQYVTCTAGDTLLYTWGRNQTGDGQLRRCRNWQGLADWAAEHSACYRDTEQPVRLGDHFGHCDDAAGGDGMLPL